jgi:hypothetical protein
MKKSTAIIFLVALALAAFVFFYDVKHNKSTDEKQASTDTESSKPAFSLDPSDITSMTIDREGTTATFEQRSGNWFMSTPVDTRADQSAVGGVASQLGSLRIDRTLPASSTTPEQLGTYGLTSPTVTIHFTVKKGDKHELRLGNKDFSGSSVYGLIDNQKNVVLMSDSILISSNKGPDDFRDQSVLNFDTNNVVSFQLHNSSGEISAVKKDGNWKIEKPRAVSADSVAVSSLLDVVSTTRVAAFVVEKDVSPAKYGFNSPMETFRAQLSDNKMVELQIGKKDGDIYYARDTSRPFIFKVKDSIFRSLSGKLADFRDKRLIHMDEASVTKLEVIRGATTAVCTKDKNGDWQPEQAAQSKAKPTYCANAWNGLNDAHVSDVYDTAPAGSEKALSHPEYQVMITGKDGTRTQVSISGAVDKDKMVYAKKQGENVIYKLDKEILDQLDASSRAVHD